MALVSEVRTVAVAVVLGDALDEDELHAGARIERVAVEHDDVRVLADLEAADAVVDAVEVGPYAVSLALSERKTLRAAPAGEVLQGVLARVEDPEARGHTLVATGLLGHGVDERELRESLNGVRYQPALLWSSAVALGLLGDNHAVETLVELLAGARSSASRAALAAALGTIGDQRAVAPLLALADDEGIPTGTKAFVVIALGLVCDRDPLPWRYPIARGLPYFASTATLIGDGNGILEIL
jgi:HEAT repeat protein